MPELRERFEVLDRLDPPDLRWEIRHRTPGRITTGPDRPRVGLAVGALALAAAGIVLVSIAFLGNRGVGGAPDGGSEEATEDRAAAVALGALTDARLHDPAGLYYDYGAVEPAGMDFVAYLCSSPPESGVCNTESADATLTVASEGQDLVVTEASGGFTEGQRAGLVGYRESLESSPEWVYEPIAIQSYEDLVNAGLMEVDGPIPVGHMVVASLYWAGPIPSDLVTSCHIALFDDQGAVVHTTNTIERAAPTVEGARDAILLAEIPEDVVAVSTRALCENSRLDP